jgi:hypothetical protein
MKLFTEFFAEKKENISRYRVKYHLDGISIQGLGSLRVSNISNNLQFLVHNITILGKKVPAFLFSTVAVFANNIQACEVNPHYSSVFLSNDEKK